MTTIITLILPYMLTASLEPVHIIFFVHHLLTKVFFFIVRTMVEVFVARKMRKWIITMRINIRVTLKTLYT